MCDICITVYPSYHRFILISLLVAAVLCCSFASLHAQARVAVNEIMYAPISPEPEWIELYNADTNLPQNLTGWSLQISSKSVGLPPASIAASGYLVLTKDSNALRQQRPGNYLIVQLALPSLRNSGDTIILFDSSHTVVDSVPYQPSWGATNGRSLERRDAEAPGTNPANWGTCIATSGATPGARNSLGMVADLPALAIVMNEVMFAPVKPESEWIEILNTTRDTIDMGGWQVVVGQGSPKTISFGTPPVPPDSLMILTASDSALASVRGISRSRIISVPIGALNNSGSQIALRDLRGNTIDTMWYAGSWIAKDGVSIERIDPARPGYEPTNWNACEDTSGSTILRPNTERILPRDLALVNISATDSPLTLTIFNAGTDTVRGIPIVLIRDALDTILSIFDSVVAPRDSIIVSIASLPTCFGLLNCVAFVADSLDMRHANDTLRFVLAEDIPADSLVINEIMFDPQAGNCEWLEVYNPSSRWVGMLGSHFTGGQKYTGYSSPLPQTIIPPFDYGLIASHDTLVLATYPTLQSRKKLILDFNRISLELTNDSCSVLLYNDDLTTIDSVRYYSSWHTTPQTDRTGISLERVAWNHASNDPRNWKSSSDPAGATPLAPNSAAHFVDTGASAVFSASFSPNPFSPDGDGFEDESVLTILTGDDISYAMRVRLYDGVGRVVRMLADVATFFRESTLTFDGRNDHGQTLPPGLYTVLVELSSQSPIRLLTKVIAVAIAGKRR